MTSSMLPAWRSVSRCVYDSLFSLLDPWHCPFIERCLVVFKLVRNGATNMACAVLRVFLRHSLLRYYDVIQLWFGPFVFRMEMHDRCYLHEGSVMMCCLLEWVYFLAKCSSRHEQTSKNKSKSRCVYSRFSKLLTLTCIGCLSVFRDVCHWLCSYILFCIKVSRVWCDRSLRFRSLLATASSGDCYWRRIYHEVFVLVCHMKEPILTGADLSSIKRTINRVALVKHVSARCLGLKMEE